MRYEVFIISHERSDRVETYDTLRTAGYTGRINVVIDDEDIQLQQYQNRFGQELVIFNKQMYIDKVDTITNKKGLSTAVYARQFVEDRAYELSLDAYITMDDDVINLRHRYVEGDVVKSQKLTQNLDKVLDAYVDFMVSCNLSAVSFSNVMLYIGGVDDIEQRIIGNREMYQIHIRNTKFPVEWKSVINNDAITELLCARQGYHLWSLPFVIYDSPKMNTLSGGMKSVYNSLTEFERAFMATIALPSVCRPVISKNHIVIGRNKKSAYPVVLSSRYKK